MELLDKMTNARVELIDHFGAGYIEDTIHDDTDMYWLIIEKTLYFSDEPMDHKTIMEVGPHYSSPILGKILNKNGYTFITKVDSQCFYTYATVLDDNKKCIDPDIIKVLEEY